MNYRHFFLTLFVVLFLPLYGQVLAQDMEAKCAAVSENNGCTDLTATECKAFLQQCSDYYDQQSAKIAADLTKTSQQKNTLANQVSSLKKKIQNLDYQITQGNVKVKGLNIQIIDTEESIDKTTHQISTAQEQIAGILRSIHQEDNKSVFAMLLEGNLSNFFGNLVHLENLNARVNMLLTNTKDLQVYLENQRKKMDSEVTQLQKTIALQQAQKVENDKNKKTQEQYLQLTEAQYQQQLQDKQSVDQKAAKIKALLFQVVGVSKAPTFGEALEIAKIAASHVGIRPAFLLAIISQESAIGRNTGQCLLVDPKTGNGKRKSTGAAIIRIMHPTRDVPPFLIITADVGRVPYGWGGAMGPAQFIPSTWMTVKSELEGILGRAADPWGITDSFTASGLYLSRLGAKAQTMAAEKNAASRYYGGSSSYANSVYNRATCIQTFVDSGTMSTYCENLIF